MLTVPLLLGLLLSLLPIASAKREYVDYTADGVACRGFVAYDETKCSPATPCPLVLIVPDWNGMNGYEMHRACLLADEGYVAFAADIYGVAPPQASS